MNLFQKADKIAITIEETDNGVKVTETSSDPCVVRLIHAHAQVVSLFIKNGYREVRKNHAVPTTD